MNPKTHGFIDQKVIIQFMNKVTLSYLNGLTVQKTKKGNGRLFFD